MSHPYCNETACKAEFSRRMATKVLLLMGVISTAKELEVKEPLLVFTNPLPLAPAFPRTYQPKF